MISVFTPTYNRAMLLPTLKDCMDIQTCMDFEWIIVDDGSIDNTDELVMSWIKQELPYSLKYIKQKNQGKHIAFNTAVNQAQGDWFICVDSDDQLTADAVATMSDDIKGIPDGCIGIIYPQKLTGSHKENEWEKINGTKIDIMDLKVEYNIPESAILMRMKDFADLKFPQVENERFIPESWLYQRLIPRGKFWVHNVAFYIAEYLEDGLTKNVWKLWAKNPTGVLNVLSEKYELLAKYPLKTRTVGKIKCIININTICMASGKSVREESPSVFLSEVLMVPSRYFYRKRFK